MGFLLLIFSAPLFYWAFQYRQKVRFLNDLTGRIDYSNGEIKEILLQGLREKYFQAHAGDEDPVTFEHLVAGIMESYYGGSAYVNEKSDNFGADLEVVRRSDEAKEMFLGQVKCQDGPVDFEPVAMIHSQVVKENASGGFIVCTGGFNEGARNYAEELDIELIDGIKLVDLWIDSLQGDRDRIPSLEGKEEELLPENA